MAYIYIYINWFYFWGDTHFMQWCSYIAFYTIISTQCTRGDPVYYYYIIYNLTIRLRSGHRN